jgi:hypothetical protein
MYPSNRLSPAVAGARLLTASALAACAAFASLTPGCSGGHSAKTFQPKSIPPGQGAVIGHVRVFKGEDEVTGSCSILFTDEKKQGIGYSLDDSGWVFATLPRGPRYLSFVNCAVWNGLFYGTDALRFDVAGGGRTTYFGDVSFYLADEDGKAFWRAVGLGIAGVPVASLAGSLASSGSQLIVTTVVITSPDGTNRVTAEDHLEKAATQYQQRFQVAPDIAVSLTGAPPDPAPVVRKHGNVLSIDTRLNGLLVVWTASVKDGEPQIVVRMNRLGPAPLFANCNEAEIIADRAAARRHPVKYQAQRTAEGHRERLEIEINRASLDSVARARSLEIKFCKVKGNISLVGIQAVSNLAKDLEALLAKLPPKAPEPEPATPMPAESPPGPEPTPIDRASPAQ